MWAGVRNSCRSNLVWKLHFHDTELKQWLIRSVEYCISTRTLYCSLFGVVRFLITNAPQKCCCFDDAVLIRYGCMVISKVGGVLEKRNLLQTTTTQNFTLNQVFIQAGKICFWFHVEICVQVKFKIFKIQKK